MEICEYCGSVMHSNTTDDEMESILCEYCGHEIPEDEK